MLVIHSSKLQLGTCNLQLATGSGQLATSNMQHATTAMKVDWHLDGRTLTHSNPNKVKLLFRVEVEIVGWKGREVPFSTCCTNIGTKLAQLHFLWKFFFGIFFDGFLIVIYSLLTLWTECIDWKFKGGEGNSGKICSTLLRFLFFGGHVNAVGGSESRLKLERNWWVDWLVERWKE